MCTNLQPDSQHNCFKIPAVYSVDFGLCLYSRCKLLSNISAMCASHMFQIILSSLIKIITETLIVLSEEPQFK